MNNYIHCEKNDTTLGKNAHCQNESLLSDCQDHVLIFH